MAQIMDESVGGDPRETCVMCDSCHDVTRVGHCQPEQAAIFSLHNDDLQILAAVDSYKTHHQLSHL